MTLNAAGDHHPAGRDDAGKIGGPVLSRAYYGKGYQRGNLDYLRTLHGKPLGNGPYVYDKYIPGREIRFHANSHFIAVRRPLRALSIA